MPIYLSPRPIRAMRIKLAWPLFIAEMTAKGIVAIAFILPLGMVPK